MIQYDSEINERLGLFQTDSNNNSSDSDKSIRGDKYSLRPRSTRRRCSNNHTKSVGDDSDELTTTTTTKTTTKTRQSKPKHKPAPLSKYRRKTANARERSRMREINQAFETLRKAVPQMSIQHQNNEKLTKITTLRLAMKYISALSAALNSNNNNETTYHDLLSDCSELDCFLLESDGESMPIQSDFSDHSLTPAELSIDFPDDSLTPVDFARLSPELCEHLNSFDPFLTGFS